MKNRQKLPLVIFVAYGTGGSEAFQQVLPVLQKMLDGICKFETLSISTYAKNKLPGSTLLQLGEAIDFIKEANAIILINESSNGNIEQNMITSLCKDLKIRNISLLDFYGKYSKRFTCCPDMIIVPSKSIYKDMSDLGFQQEILIVAGNPAFDRLSLLKQSNDIACLNRILFASQVVDKTNKRISQIEIFKEFYEEISLQMSDFKINIKLHPQEASDAWEQIIEGYPKAEILLFDNKGDFLTHCMEYHLIIGYNSTLQLQTSMIGIPTIFYELGNIDLELTKYVNGEISLHKHPYSDFEKGSTNKVVKIIKTEIEKLI